MKAKRTMIRYPLLFITLLLSSFAFGQNAADTSKDNRVHGVSISLTEFNDLVDSCSHLLHTKALKDISDEQHSKIIRALNTIRYSNGFKKGRYTELLALSENVNYGWELERMYDDWQPSGGMGLYLPKLKIALGGVPAEHFTYHVTGYKAQSILVNDKPAPTAKFDRDRSPTISIIDFDKLVDSCLILLQTKKTKDISDAQHIRIMYALNTIFMGRFKGGRYDQLSELAEKVYVKSITEVYPDWGPNRGMGFYFPKLHMELYGTPSPYAVYSVIW